MHQQCAELFQAAGEIGSAQRQLQAAERLAQNYDTR
jgi:hypothetical protein